MNDPRPAPELPAIDAIESNPKLEAAVVYHGAAWFGLVLFSYYMLRPIREQIGSTYGTENLSKMFIGSFITMLIAIPLYSVLVGRYHRRQLVPSIYALFIALLFGFWIAMQQAPEHLKIWVARALYIFISVYGLFIVSFFWSVVGDMLSTGQGRRLFGYIAGGGTIGGLIGSKVAGSFVERIGVANLLLFPIVLLAIGLVLYWLLEMSYTRHAGERAVSTSGKATGGNPFAGFTAVFTSRYLIAICFYRAFLALCGTTVYFQQAEIVKATFEMDTAQAEYYADINFYVQLVTLVFQFGIVKWLMKHAGLGITLAALPVAYICGMSLLALYPVIGVLAVISVVGRAVEYGIGNPAREVLFTSVDREDRYKAKSFIDTVVRRGGDTVAGNVYSWLRDAGGFAMTSMSWLVMPVAVVWVGMALFIGKENERVRQAVEGDENDGGD